MQKEWFHRPASSQNKVAGCRSMRSCPRCDVAESRNRPLRSTCSFRNEPKTFDRHVRKLVRHRPIFFGAVGVYGRIHGVPPLPLQNGAAALGILWVAWGAGGWRSEMVRPVYCYASSGAISRPEHRCGYTVVALG